MLRSTNQEDNEYAIVKRPEHVEKVWAVIEPNLSKYWSRFVESIKNDGETEGEAANRVFDKAIASYEKDAKRYRDFFDPEAMEEYLDDPNAFKQGLSRDVPVNANTLRQQHRELTEWQIHFRSARANELLEVFSNVLDFHEEWSELHTVRNFVNHDATEDFGLDPLDDDESMSITNVVGMGIKSIILFNLDPKRMPQRGRNGLYGLFFLSDRQNFGLPSNSSEFLMINDVQPASDGSMILDQNYWYPYGTFSLYALRIFRWMKKRGEENGFAVDDRVRFVYVERFFQGVCDLHRDDLKTMRAHERFEVPA